MFLAELSTTHRPLSRQPYGYGIAIVSRLITGSWLLAIAACSTSPVDSNAGSSGSPFAGQTAMGNAAAGTASSVNGATMPKSSMGGAVAGSAGQYAARAGGGTSGAAGTQAVAGGTRASSGQGGNAAGSGGATGTPSSSSCGSVTFNQYPFGCKLAWGTNDTGASLASLAFLQFITKWVDWQISADGTVPSCDGCNWLSGTVASTNLIPVYYAYFVGYFGHANGLPDQNVNPNGPNLATDGAELIRNNRSKIINMYSSYAKSTAQVWKDKPLVWLLEGDFIQYGDSGQKNPLSYGELAQLTADITCAIKTAMPNAVVAINHTTWNGDDETKGFWGAMTSAGVAYDMVWTTGVANNNGFIESAGAPGYYNNATATYSYIHGLTGRPILVDTSFGLSGMSDSWSSASAAILNQRIAEGVSAVNVGELKQGTATYESAIKALAPQLKAVCE
jgi:hypothetical protein